MADRPGRDLLALCLVALLAFAACYGHHLYFERAGIPLRPVLDEKADLERAERLLAGKWPDAERPFYQAPLYPFFLAGVQKLLGPHADTPRILQFAFVAAAAAIAFAIARRLHSLPAAVIAGLFVGLCKPLVFFSRLHIKTTLAVLLVSGWLLLYLDGRRRDSLPRLAASGLLLGTACLVRDNLLAFIPLFALGLLLQPVERSRRVLLAGAFFIAAALPIAPATWHNHRAGSLVLTTWQGGTVFYTGNHRGNRQGGYALPSFLKPGQATETEGQGWRDQAELATGQKLTPRQVSGYWFRMGLAELVEQPGRASRLLLRKLLLFWNRYEMPANVDLQFMRSLDGFLRWPLPDFGWLALLAPGALWMLWRTREARPLLLYVVVSWLAISAFFVLGRYRLALVPALAVGGGMFCAELFARLRLRDGRWLAGAAVLLAAGGWVAFRPVDRQHQGDSWYHLGAAYEEDGRLEQAARAYARAIADNPRDARPHTRLGTLHHRQGQLDEALHLLDRAYELDHKAADALNGLGAIHFDRGNYPEAEKFLLLAEDELPDRPEIQRNLAILYRRLKRHDKALLHAWRTVKMMIWDLPAQEIVADSLFALGRTEQAAEAYRTLRRQSNGQDLRAHVGEARCRRLLGQTDRVKRLEELIRRTFPEPQAQRAIEAINR